MTEFVLFGKDLHPVYFMPNIFLKDNINRLRFTKFYLAYIRNKTHTPHKEMVKLCREVHYMWLGNQELELQEWKDCIN